MPPAMIASRLGGRVHRLTRAGDAVAARPGPCAASGYRDRRTSAPSITPPSPVGGADGQRISSTGVTPMTARPERITIAVAATRASRATCRLQAVRLQEPQRGIVLPRFHSI